VTAKLNVVNRSERNFLSSGSGTSTNIIPGSLKRTSHIVRIFLMNTGLMLLTSLNRVYERDLKRSAGKNAKQRNSSRTAPVKRLQVNLQVVGRCLRDVDEAI
jgi:hypothetical protein